MPLMAYNGLTEGTDSGWPFYRLEFLSFLFCLVGGFWNHNTWSEPGVSVLVLLFLDRTGME
jgi:hypothetical protein